jgi:hypothetical protein
VSITLTDREPAASEFTEVMAPMLINITDVTLLGLARLAAIETTPRLAITILLTSAMSWKITMMPQSRRPSKHPPFRVQ